MALHKNRAKKPPDKLYVETRGTGDRHIVFLAGLGGTTRYWASGAGPLEADYTVILIDLLGFGNSPKPWTRYDIERHVSAVHHVLKEYDSFTLVGHSLGSMVGAAYAAQNSQQVKKLVLMSLPYFGSKDRAYDYLRGGTVRGGFLFTNIILTMLTCILTRRVFGKILPYLVRDLPREIVSDLVKHTWRSSTSSLWEVVYRHDVSKDLQSLPVNLDVEFIHGDKDVSAPISPVKAIAASRSNWHLTTLSGVDHHPFIRAPKTCLDIIKT